MSAGRLPIALSAYAEEHPEVDLQFVEGDRSRMVEGINSRAIDIAVLHGAPDNKLGEPLMLWHERLYVLIAADHRLAGRSEVLWSDIEEETFLVAARTVGAEAVQLLAGRYGRGRSPVTRSHLISRETALSMVGMSLGLTLMLESGLGRLPQGVVAIPLASSDGETLIPLTAYRDPSNDNPPLRRLWSFLKRGYAESGRAAAE